MEKENKNSKSKISANNRYVEKAYDKFTFRLPKGNREKLQEIAQKKYGGSINAFLTDVVIDKLKGGYLVSVPDLEAYARSAGTDPEKYIIDAVKAKMKLQDDNFIE